MPIDDVIASLYRMMDQRDGKGNESENWMHMISYLASFTSMWLTYWIHYCQCLQELANMPKLIQLRRSVTSLARFCLCVGVILSCSCASCAIVDQRLLDMVERL